MFTRKFYRNIRLGAKISTRLIAPFRRNLFRAERYDRRGCDTRSKSITLVTDASYPTRLIIFRICVYSVHYKGGSKHAFLRFSRSKGSEKVSPGEEISLREIGVEV